MLATIPGATAQYKDLVDWKNVHIAALQNLAAQELGVFHDPSKAERELFSITVRARPQQSIETRFMIISAEPRLFEDTGDFTARVQQAYKVATDRAKPPLRPFMIAILIEGIPIPYLVPTDFCPGYVPPGPHNLTALKRMINRGEVARLISS